MDTKKILLGVFFVSIFVVSGALSYFWGIYNKIYVKTETVTTTIAPSITTTPTPTPDPMGPRNILLLGYGGQEHVGGFLTDTIILAHIIPREDKVTLISIPRDIFVRLPIKEGEYQKFKINHAYPIGNDDAKYPDKPTQFTGRAGGGNMAKYAVEKVTGLPAHNFVSINFTGFKNIVDTLGGIEVFVPYSFKDEYYPIKGEEDNSCEKTEDEIEKLTATMSGELLEREFKCRFETLEFERGTTHMDGETALEFVRSRHSEVGGSDFGRARRQQAFLTAMKDKLLSYKSIPRLIPVINLLASNVLTDVDIKTGVELLRKHGLTDVEIKSISLTTENVLDETYEENGQYILVPKGGEENWQIIHEFIQENLKN